MAKQGRPQKPDENLGGGSPGLNHCPDGRWRMTDTGQKYTEADERRAVARSRAMNASATIDPPAMFRAGPPGAACLAEAGAG